MNLCCKFVAGVYTPSVRNIPISKDEQFCMREAQFHSAAPPTLAPNPSQTSASQHLDPVAQQPSKSMPGGGIRRTSKPAVSSNSLLKQAIANRISGEVEAMQKEKEVSAESKEPAKIHKTDSNEMSKSVLLNPAWYRDEQGRTGYKTSDWENVSNKQKDVVKQKKGGKKGAVDDGIKELDTDLLSDNSGGGGKESASGSQTPTPTPSECSDPKKLAKELKKREKEMKKAEEKAKKEEKKLKKKKAKEGTEKTDKESDIVVEAEEVVAEVKQKEKSTEKAAATIKLTLTPKRTPTSIRKLKTESSGNPKKTTIGERRDSNMSIASRGSFKSVTFNDRVETREIERNSNISSSEDDAAIMSDDELARPSLARRKKIATLRQAQQQQQYNEQQQQQEQHHEHQDFYGNDDLDDFEEQERLALLGNAPQYVISQQEYEEDDDEEEEENDEDTISQNSYYAEDREGADIYLRNEQSFIEMEITPAEVMGSDVIYERNMMGSMSKLHGDDSSASLLFGYQLPRSASGYFEPGAMNYSYEEAIRGPGVHGLPIPPNQLKVTSTQRSVYENMESPVSLPPGQGGAFLAAGNTSGPGRYYPVQELLQQPSSSAQGSPYSSRNQLARQQFFTSTTQTPTNTVSKTTEAMSQSSSTSTLKEEGEESEMRKKFVARFGARKAPIAHREEDPADPVHGMGSQESMNSTDSRESVVSAASVRAEAIARRNFNY